MREADRIVADTLLLLAENARPGATTRELDDLATDYVRSRGGEPSFPLVNFNGTTCISVNEEIVHGIPGKRVLRDGDIVSLDLGVVYKGWHGDAAITAPVGAISSKAQRLLDVTTRALALAIAQVRRATPIRRERGGRGLRQGGGVGARATIRGAWHRPQHARRAAGAELSPAQGGRGPCCGRVWLLPSSRW